MSGSIDNENSGAVRVALVGCGYWGRNLLRNIIGATDVFDLRYVCDPAAEVRAWAAEEYGASTSQNFEDILADESVEAVVLATPPGLHAEQAGAALRAGKHVLVEKPMALHAAEVRALANQAEQSGLTLMAGHTFLYHGAVLFAKEMIDRGELGDIHYISSRRLAMGRVRDDVDPMWNLAPHDLSIINYLLGSAPNSVSAHASHALGRPLADVQFLHLNYQAEDDAHKIQAHIHVSWLNPNKVRELTIVGSKRILVFDDIEKVYKIAMLETGGNKDVAAPEFASFAEFQNLTRRGDALYPEVAVPEPLGEELRHFAHCIRTGAAPRSSAASAAAVVATLEAAEQSISQTGAKISINQMN